MIVSTAAAQTTATWTLRELAVIGSMNDVENALSRIGTAIIAPPDHIFVSQPQELLIRVFDSRGRLIRTLGRPGDGPGEFRSISSIGLLDGNLYVADNNQKRVSWFSTTGSFLRSKARMSPGIRRPGIAYMPTAPQTLLPAGRAIAIPGTAVPYPPPAKPQPMRIPVLLLDSADRAIDTLTWMVRPALTIVLGKGNIPIANPFASTTLQTVSPDGGVVIVNSGTDRVVVQKRLSGGKAVFSTTITYKPIAISTEAIRRAARDVLFNLRREGVLPISTLTITDVETGLQKSGALPRTLPPVTRITATQDGSTWLRGESVGAKSTWSVIDRMGALKATIGMLHDESVIAFDGSLLVTLYFDELDVPLLRVYRVQF